MPAAARLSLEGLRNDASALRAGLHGAERVLREAARADAGRTRLRGGSTVTSATASAATVGAGAGAGAQPLAAAPSALDASSARSEPTSPVPVSMPGTAPASPAGGPPGAPPSSPAPIISDGALEGGADVPLLPAPATESLHDFVARAQTEMEAMDARVESACSTFHELLSFFGEDEHMSVETFFTVITQFLNALRKAVQDNEADEARAQREAKRAAAASSTGASARKSVASQGHTPASGTPRGSTSRSAATPTGTPTLES